MIEFIKFGRPGEAHQRLRAMAGDWDLKGRFRVGEDGPWTDFDAKMKGDMLLGGRFLSLRIQGEATEWMPMVYEGVRILGYDNYTGEFLSVAMGNFSTAILVTKGKCEPSCSTVTLTGSAEDPLTRRTKSLKTVFHFQGGDAFRLEEYDVAPDGSAYVAIEVTHTRAGSR
jgi:hypothetical protein